MLAVLSTITRRFIWLYFKIDTSVGCDDTSLVLITPAAMPDLTHHRYGKRTAEVFEKAIRTGKPSIEANIWVLRIAASGGRRVSAFGIGLNAE